MAVKFDRSRCEPIGEVLDFSRIEAGVLTLDRVACDLHGLAEAGAALPRAPDRMLSEVRRAR